MTGRYLQLNKVLFRGPKKEAQLDLACGVNVICGASDTGKSFLIETINYMLGGSSLREITELSKYNEIELYLNRQEDEEWCLKRSVSGGDFTLFDLENPDNQSLVLKSKHTKNKTNTISAFLLDLIGLQEKIILRSKKKLTTQNLSFRNLARLILINEYDIQQRESPFWSGQYTDKTSDLATVKLLLTGIDDSAIISNSSNSNETYNITHKIDFIGELIDEIKIEINEEVTGSLSEVSLQLEQIRLNIEDKRALLNTVQLKLDNLLTQRRKTINKKTVMQNRLDETNDMLARFILLKKHYLIDINRLQAIQESGSLFLHTPSSFCPLCGAHPEKQHIEESCDINIESIIDASVAEIHKIKRLIHELDTTAQDLEIEKQNVINNIDREENIYQDLEINIQQISGPNVEEAQLSFSCLIEKRYTLENALDLFTRYEKLESWRSKLLQESDSGVNGTNVEINISKNTINSFSLKVALILKAWGFPGDGNVYYDEKTLDFVIDGKPRGSHGKGLRAITHAAISIALLEYCQENDLSHPGFLVLDSPLLAYFEPEDSDDQAVKDSDLKERFYAYLVKHHSKYSQVIIIENEHPPENLIKYISLKVFTGNPAIGRFGLL